MKKLLANIVILGAKPVAGLKTFGPIANINISNKKTILDIQLKNLNKRFVSDNIIYVGGYKADIMGIKNPNITYIYNDRFNCKNNGYSLNLAAQHLKYNSTLIVFGKTLFHYRIFDTILKNPISSILTDKSKDNTYAVGCNIGVESNEINNLFYGLDHKICGIYLIKDKEHNLFKNILKTKTNVDNNFVFEIINDIIDAGGKFKSVEIQHKLVKQIDSSKALKSTIRSYVKNFSS